ncbi:DDE-type integrase/transposase/recombinase [Afifella marina]|uniref:Mu DNA-binding domain-containing protein n=1 Tax=Afifella marina DSM 2698 TaxID=1120955 RepID=A0A1G5MGK7_AFIMA|nr:DDE-type integrase/transposase/recombinase [Afifella marina]MBK1625223.1 hypothetical protein [Afifella marina DSM 2698]MBK1628940.1 hypothetical protein [Afifella marina]MBK5918319.1 hypothetical protein [Afifella marina]RAI22838.1 hypothetical protein CH311_04075 [Afifella marina DSM 2698]SCZ23771.1 Mu DNA-binding domain-containing protein [Afifella marina DSM 2698]
MKEWLTAQEIANERLYDLPETKMGVKRLAEREGWNDHPLARTRQGRGGGMEYHYRILPTLAQIAYFQRHARLSTAPAVHDEQAAGSRPTEHDLAPSGRAAQERDARLAIVHHFGRFAGGITLGRTAAAQLYCDKYNNRSLAIDDWIVEAVPRISKRSLARWRAEAKTGGARLGFDKGQARKGKSVLDQAEGGRVRATILALLADNQHFSAHHIRDLIAAEYGETLAMPGREKRVPLPPIRTFQHHLKALRTSEAVTLLRVQNPDRFRSIAAPRGTNSLAHVQEPNALWQIDASPVDALCTDGRHAIYVCLDIATRRMTLLVSRTPRASAVALLIRKAILAWGVPDLIKTDNGSDFVARDTKRLFGSLGIEIELSDPYQPQQKAHVERAIGTFQHDCATLLPGFVGHSVADRSAIESRKSFAARLGEKDEATFGVSLSGEDLQAVVDRWVGTYEQRPHSGLKGATPALAAAQSARPIRHVDERALDLLLMSVPGGGTRRVTSQGIRVNGAYYMTPTILPGTEVLVRMDSSDLGLVYAFTPDGAEHLGCGICPSLSGIDPAAAAKAMKSLQNEITANGAAVIKAEIRRLKKNGAYHERILAVREARAPNVVALPPRSEQHTTPQIDAAIAASKAGEPVRTEDSERTPEQLRLIEEMRVAEEAEVHARYEETMAAHERARAAEREAGLPENVTRLPESPKERYLRAVAVREAVDAGEADPRDAVWLGRYETTPEYRAHRDLHEEFGDVYLGRSQIKENPAPKVRLGPGQDGPRSSGQVQRGS